MNPIYTTEIEFAIGATTQINRQPDDLNSCYGSQLSTEIYVSVTDVTDGFVTQYQWFKNGKPFYRTNNEGNIVTPDDNYIIDYIDSTQIFENNILV